MHLTESKNSKILCNSYGIVGLSFGDTSSVRDAHIRGVGTISATLGAPKHIRNLHSNEGVFYDWLKRDHKRSFLAKLMIPQMDPPQIGVRNFQADPRGTDKLQWVCFDNSMEGIYLAPYFESDLGYPRRSLDLKRSLALENYTKPKYDGCEIWADTGVYSSWSGASFLMVARKEQHISNIHSFFESVKETPSNLVIWQDPDSDNLQLFDKSKMTDAELFTIYREDLMRFERARKWYNKKHGLTTASIKHTYEIKDNVVDMML